MIARRTFLKYLAASPRLATTSPGRMLAAAILDEGESSLADYLIKSPADALDVFDFQRVAQQILPVAHYGYLATGTDGNETLTANRAAFDRFYLRPMSMVDTGRVNLATTLLGSALKSPIAIVSAATARMSQ